MSVAGKPPAIAADGLLVAILRVPSKRARLFHRAPCHALILRAGNPHRIALRNGFLRAVDKPVRKGHSGCDLDIMPRLRPSWTLLNTTLFSSSTLATCIPCGPMIKAVAGMRRTFGSDGM
jgi:hypothetical protein